MSHVPLAEPGPRAPHPWVWSVLYFPFGLTFGFPSIALGFLASASFPDAKRPITKALLQRLDLRAILERADRPRLRERASRSMAVELGIDSSLGLLDEVDEALAMLENG